MAALTSPAHLIKESRDFMAASSSSSIFSSAPVKKFLNAIPSVTEQLEEGPDGWLRKVGLSKL